MAAMEQFDQHQQGNEETVVSDQRRENVDTGSRNIQQRGQFEGNRIPAQSAKFPPRPVTPYPDDSRYKQPTPERKERNLSLGLKSDEQRVQRVGAQVKKVGNVTNPSRTVTNKDPHGALKQQGYQVGNLNEVPTQWSHRDDNQHDNRRPSEAPINSSEKQSMKGQHKRTIVVEYKSDQNYPVPDNRAPRSSEHQQQSQPKEARVTARNMEQSQRPDENNSNTRNDENQMDDSYESDGSDYPSSKSVSSKSSSSQSDSSSDRESSRSATPYPDDSRYKQSTPERKERNLSLGPKSDEQRAQHRRQVGAQVKKVGIADWRDSGREEQKQHPGNVTKPSHRADNKYLHDALKELGYHRGNLNEVPTQLSHKDDNQHDKKCRKCGRVHKPGNCKPSEAPINSSKKQSMKQQLKRSRDVEYKSDQIDLVPDNRAPRSSEHEQQSRPKKARVTTRNMEQSQWPDDNSDTSNDENQTDDSYERDGSDYPSSKSVSSKSSSSQSDRSSHRESSRSGRSTAKGSSDSDVIIKCSTGIRFDPRNAAHKKVVIGFENVTATYRLTETY